MRADADARLAEEAARALEWDLWVPRGRVTATVRDGWVTLEGEVDSRFQQVAAQGDVARLPGVVGVRNALTLRPVPAAAEVAARLVSVLGAAAEALLVETFPGAVVIRGTVASRRARESAVRALRSVAHVTEVVDHLQVVDRGRIQSNRTVSHRESRGSRGTRSRSSGSSAPSA